MVAPVAKIESIRPGGTLETSFAEYPLAELLIGVLRGNLTGCLELMFEKDRANQIYFKDGVPVSVDLPGLGVSVARILVEKGVIDKSVGMEILRQSEDTGRRESSLIVEERILSEGAMVDARRKRARDEVVRLFDALDTKFRFTEGAMFPPTAALTVLQPLPIVFEGLLKSRVRALVDRFIEEYGGAQFKLSATYPRGVDPFEWGERVERVIASLHESHRSLADLERALLDRDLAAAAMTTLHLAGMIELARAVHGKMRTGGSAETEGHIEYVNLRGEPVAKPSRSSAKEAGLDSPSSSSGERDPSGLVIVRRSSGQTERPRSDPRNAPLDPPPSARAAEPPRDPSAGLRAVTRSEAEHAQYESQLEQIGAKLAPLRGKSYYKVLRIADGAPPDQIERSFRYLVRQVDEQGDDVPMRALRDAYREAYEVLMDPADGRRYRDLSERVKQSAAVAPERQAFEAAQKVDRAVRAMVDGRIAEALYLLDWATQLEPARKDLKVYRQLVRYLRSPRHQRGAEAHAMKGQVAQEVQRAPHDRTLLLVLALVLAEDKDPVGAEQLLARAERPDHPLARRVRELLSELKY
jgi:uncharacterized protein DUF4388